MDKVKLNRRRERKLYRNFLLSRSFREEKREELIN